MLISIGAHTGSLQDDLAPTSPLGTESAYVAWSCRHFTAVSPIRAIVITAQGRVIVENDMGFHRGITAKVKAAERRYVKRRLAAGLPPPSGIEQLGWATLVLLSLAFPPFALVLVVAMFIKYYKDENRIRAKANLPIVPSIGRCDVCNSGYWANYNFCRNCGRKIIRETPNYNVVLK